MVIYFVNGNQQQSDQNILNQDELLQRAGYSSVDYYVTSENGKEYRRPDDEILISGGEKFFVKPYRGESADTNIVYEVNGESQETTQSPINLETVLRNAGHGAGIDLSDLNNYRLENVITNDRYNNLDELVPINNGDKFIAIYTGSTPVA